MPTHAGITMTMRVDHHDLPEFMVNNDPTHKKVSCWVPSQLGKEFEILVDNGHQGGVWTAAVKADGTLASTFIFDQVKRKNVAFYQQSTVVWRPFTFSEVELVDDDDLLDASHASRIGEIEIQCYYFQKTGSSHPSHYNREFSDHKRIHEKAKKGVAEHIGLGREMVLPPGRAITGRWRENFITFVFRYRSLGFLQAQGIAPPTNPLLPSTGPTRIEKAKGRQEQKEVKAGQTHEGKGEYNEEELNALVASIEERKRQKRKQEPTPAGPVQKKVKKENRPRPLPEDIIDLT